MKKVILLIILSVLANLALISAASTTKDFNFDVATYNSTEKGYVQAGVGVYCKSTSGGTTLVSTNNTCSPFLSSITTTSSSFVFRTDVDITGLEIVGTAFTARQILAITSSKTLAGIYTTVAHTSYGSINGTASTSITGTDFNSGLVIPAGTYLNLNLGGSGITICHITLKVKPRGPELNIKQASSAIVCGGSSVDFGTSLLGNPSSQTITLQNKGESDMLISSISSSGDFIITSTIPSLIAAGDSANVDVQFKPTKVGLCNGTLTVNNNENNDAINEQACSIALSGIGASSYPAISISPTYIGGLSYEVSSGPSSVKQFTVYGYNLTAGTVSLAGLSKYEISVDGGTTWNANAFTFSTADFTQVLLVRLKAGLALSPDYTETISISTNGLTEILTLHGLVRLFPQIIEPSVESLKGMNYIIGTGPSLQAKTFTLSGSGLLPGNVTVEAPASYEVSQDGVNFSSSLSIAQPYLPTTIITVRLKAGLELSQYNENIKIYGGGIAQANAVNIPLEGQVYDSSSLVSCPGIYAYGVNFDSGSVTYVSGNDLETFSSTLTPSTDTPLPASTYAITSNPKSLDSSYTEILNGDKVLVANTGAGSAIGIFTYKADVVPMKTYRVTFTVCNVSSCAANSIKIYAKRYYADDSNPISLTLTGISTSNYSIAAGACQTFTGTFATNFTNASRIRLFIDKASSLGCGAISISDITMEGCSAHEITTDQPGDKVCQGSPVVLSVSPATSSNCVWESRPTAGNGAWTAMPSTTATLSVAPLVDTDYRVQINGITILKTVRAVVCCENMSKMTTIFEDDFGTVASGVRTTNPYVTGYTYAPTGEIGDGRYAVVSKAIDGAIYWRNMTDKAGNTNGAMLVVNGSAPGQVVYRRSYTGLCANTIYDLSAYIANIHSSTTTNLPNLTFYIKSLDGSTVLDMVNTGDIPFGGNWFPRGISFNSGVNSGVMLEIQSNRPSGGGNDFALDDIRFTTCAPTPIVYTGLNTFSRDTTVCEDASFDLTAYTQYDISKFYPTAYYQWQYSTDNGSTWLKLGAASTSNTFTLNPATIGLGNTNCYRAIVGSSFSNISKVEDSLRTGSVAGLTSCDSYGISTSACVARAAVPSLNMGANQTISACVGEKVTLLGSTTAPYWSWERRTTSGEIVAKGNLDSDKTLEWTVSGEEDIYFYGYTSSASSSLRAVQVFHISVLELGVPVVSNYSSCMSTGMSSWSSLVTVPTGQTAFWYTDNAKNTVGTSTLPAAFDHNIPGAYYKWVSLKTPIGCESQRVPVTVDVIMIPAPSVTDKSECQGGPTVSYSVATNLSGATLLWYSNGTGGVGSPTTPTQSTTTIGTFTKYVSQVQSGCESFRVPVTVSIVSTPTITSVTPANACGTSSSVLQATSSVGSTVHWYDAPTGGTLLASNAHLFTTPLINSSTSYYVSAAIGSCVSIPRIPVTAVVYPLPNPITGITSLCQGVTSSLSSTTAGGTWFSDNSGVASITSAGVVTANTPGTSKISYVNAGCAVYDIVTVNPLPAEIAGLSAVSIGSTILLENATPLGSWFSSNDALAVVTPLGVVTGVATGAPVISYKIGDCISSKTITVSAPVSVGKADIYAWQVYASKGSIVFKGCVGNNVEIRDIRGISIYSGTISIAEQAIEVPSNALYLVLINGSPVKVLVQ